MKNSILTLLLVFTLAAASAHAEPLFHCTVTKVTNPSILGEEVLNTAKYSEVTGAKEEDHTHIFLGAVLFVDGEYGFTISSTPSETAKESRVYVIEHTETGLKFMVHTDTGTLSIRGKDDTKELVYANIRCD